MITLTTCQQYPDLPETLRPLQTALCARGYECQVHPWQNCPESSLILPLCAWDYSLEPQRFAQWIGQNTPCFLNAAELMRWNMHKRYLCDLEESGVEVIPTEIAPANATIIADILAKNQWQTAVIKPAIGQSGKGVQKIHAGQSLDLSGYAGEMVVQPFIPEVAAAGETSLIFFHGEFSHSVRRQPPENEWRANSAYGVVIHPAKPSEAIINQAKKTLLALPHLPSYARVDGTIIGEHFLLNELELIEPALYLHTAPHATERFADVIYARLG